MSPLLHRDAPEGEQNRAFDLPRVFKVESPDSDGRLSMFLETVPPGAGPPLHVHEREHETFHVLEGTLRFHSEGVDHEVETGGTIVVPPGTPHAFKNEGESDARTLILMTPGGFEGFFRAVEEEGLHPATGMERITEIAAEYGLRFVGPPL